MTARMPLAVQFSVEKGHDFTVAMPGWHQTRSGKPKKWGPLLPQQHPETSRKSNTTSIRAWSRAHLATLVVDELLTPKPLTASSRKNWRGNLSKNPLTPMTLKGVVWVTMPTVCVSHVRRSSGKPASEGQMCGGTHWDYQEWILKRAVKKVYVFGLKKKKHCGIAAYSVPFDIQSCIVLQNAQK